MKSRNECCNLSIGLYIVLAPLYLKSVRKLQEKRFVFVKILAIIIPENGAKVSKIKCFQFAQQTLSSDYKNDDLSFYWIEDNGNIHTDFVSFYKKNISNDLCIFDCNKNHTLLYGGATIDRVYKNINDFKENKNELYNIYYNKLIDEKQDMFYCVLNHKDNSDEVIISPNHKNYFDFSHNHTIKIQNNNIHSQNNNNDKNNYITISPYQLTSFITTLNKLKQMYESHGINV